MYAMAKLRSNPTRRSLLFACCFVLSLSSGCARQEPLQRTVGSSAGSEQKLPFHSDTHQGPDSDGARPIVPPDPELVTAMPFQAGSRPRLLPSGTLLTVQLGGSLSAASVRAGDTFTASVTSPLVIDGETIVERGSPVTGRIESEQTNLGRAPALGYFRLTLNAITVGGRPVPLQTSSLFARGTIQRSNVSSGSGTVRVQKGRRLTFRLIAPVTLEAPNSTARRQLASSTTE
jgi:hypothetical protein